MPYLVNFFGRLAAQAQLYVLARGLAERRHHPFCIIYNLSKCDVIQGRDSLRYRYDVWTTSSSSSRMALVVGADMILTQVADFD